jgi:hypothetical protein
MRSHKKGKIILNYFENDGKLRETISIVQVADSDGTISSADTTEIVDVQWALNLSIFNNKVSTAAVVMAMF